MEAPYIAQGKALGILTVFKRGAELIPGQQATAVASTPVPLTRAELQPRRAGNLLDRF